MPASKKSVHKRLFGDENYLVRTGLVLVLVTLAIMNAAYIVTNLRNTSDSSGSGYGNQPHRLLSNQTAQTPSVEASISDVSESARPDPAFKLAEGEKLLLVRLKLANSTKTPQQFIPTSALYVRTPQGDMRMMHPSLFIVDQIYSGTMKPGQTIEGQIAFSVPKNATEPLLYIDTGWNNEIPIVFKPLQ